MEMVNFSVTNFRSITKAHKVSISDTTVLIGRNNEGKSNLLRALDVAMTSLQRHAMEHRFGKGSSRYFSRRDEKTYLWERDFPINLQDRKSGTQTIIRLEFLLDEEEVSEFRESIKSNLNGTMPIVIKIGKDSVPSIEVSKRGKGSKTLNSKSSQIANFIANKIINKANTPRHSVVCYTHQSNISVIADFKSVAFLAIPHLFHIILPNLLWKWSTDCEPLLLIKCLFVTDK